MRYQSKVIENGAVTFPEFMGERVYMLGFKQKDGLPVHLNRWQSIVDQMLRGISTDETIYLMIDEQFVPAGKTHRRPGVHIDGYWNPAMRCHGSYDSRHGHDSSLRIIRKPVSNPQPKLKKKPKKKSKLSWETAEFDTPEALFLASNVKASRGYIGEFSGSVGNMGDCKDVSISGLNEVVLDANKVYIGNITFLHESIPVEQDCYRTVVRLNVPGLEL